MLHAFRFQLTQLCIVTALWLGLFFGATQPIFAQSTCQSSCSNQDLDCLKAQQSCWESKINSAQQQTVSLQSTIAVMTGQINVQQLQISQTELEIQQLEQEILLLSQQISNLEVSLDTLSSALITQVQFHYKQRATSRIASLLFTHTLSTFLSQQQYLQLAQAHLTNLLQQSETQRLDFDRQKALKEQKQRQVQQKEAQLVTQHIELSNKKALQQQILVETKNNETTFQAELDRTRAEIEATQAILAGKGTETKVGEVRQGDTIATLIQGASCNSSGTHLHFSVVKDGARQNPFDFLKNGIEYSNCSGLNNGCFAADEFNPRGDWEWPIDPKISFTQGYGATWSAQHGWVSSLYSFHDGIDISSNSNKIKAVKDGILFRGSYSGQNGCFLKYVRVEHPNAYSTYYLHVNF